MGDPMSVILKTPSNGSVTLAEQDTASDVVVTVPARTGNVAVDGPAFSAYQSSAQSISASTWTKVQLQTEEFDTASAFDSTTNYRFTPQVAGYYQVNGGVEWAFSSGMGASSIYKNGTIFKVGNFSAATSVGTGAVVSALIYLNGSTDYVELYCYQTNGTVNTSNGIPTVYFQASMVRAA